MDGDLMASRYAYDAFAVVSTNGVAGVSVLRDNRPAGTTNASGHLLIPDLLAWQTNRLVIDSEALPPDISLAADRLDITPRGQSGVLASFAMGRYRGATLILVDDAGQPIPVGAEAALDTGERAVVGYDGQVFFPTLAPTNRISVRWGERECEVQVPFDEGEAMRTLGPFRCGEASR